MTDNAMHEKTLRKHLSYQSELLKLLHCELNSSFSFLSVFLFFLLDNFFIFDFRSVYLTGKLRKKTSLDRDTV